MFGRQKETHMNLQTLLDREEIIDLISTYNKASFYCDLKGYADTFTPDGRYINANHGWVGFGGAEASDAIAAEYRGGTGLQHLCLDFLIDFIDKDKALVRHHMLMFQREGRSNPNQIWNTGFYYRTVVRSPHGWRFSEIISFVDRKMSDELVTNLRGLVLARPVVLNALSQLLQVSGAVILERVKTGEALASLRSGSVSESDVIETVAKAFQACAPRTNPLPMGTARALAYVLTHDQVFGAEVEDNFRAAGWEGPPTTIGPALARKA
jgi:SnoaL-like domain